eukprot:TRINITY_DN15227_c0_g1_i7.p1 TRINITY_DN15227_c0_g1~~TRINITY_DN15227_c0_g1_i7.p1  ORF type:complete len:857 (+),score=129.06 TRINITY_DN15227_c0_g1_i7:59-2629(+)
MQRNRWQTMEEIPCIDPAEEDSRQSRSTSQAPSSGSTSQALTEFGVASTAPSYSDPQGSSRLAEEIAAQLLPKLQQLVTPGLVTLSASSKTVEEVSKLVEKLASRVDAIESLHRTLLEHLGRPDYENVPEAQGISLSSGSDESAYSTTGGVHVTAAKQNQINAAEANQTQVNRYGRALTDPCLSKCTDEAEHHELTEPVVSDEPPHQLRLASSSASVLPRILEGDADQSMPEAPDRSISNPCTSLSLTSSASSGSRSCISSSSKGKAEQQDKRLHRHHSQSVPGSHSSISSSSKGPAEQQDNLLNKHQSESLPCLPVLNEDSSESKNARLAISVPDLPSITDEMHKNINNVKERLKGFANRQSTSPQTHKYDAVCQDDVPDFDSHPDQGLATEEVELQDVENNEPGQVRESLPGEVEDKSTIEVRRYTMKRAIQHADDSGSRHEDPDASAACLQPQVWGAATGDVSCILPAVRGDANGRHRKNLFRLHMERLCREQFADSALTDVPLSDAQVDANTSRWQIFQCLFAQKTLKLAGDLLTCSMLCASGHSSHRGCKALAASLALGALGGSCFIWAFSSGCIYRQFASDFAVNLAPTMCLVGVFSKASAISRSRAFFESFFQQNDLMETMKGSSRLDAMLAMLFWSLMLAAGKNFSPEDSRFCGSPGLQLASEACFATSSWLLVSLVLAFCHQCRAMEMVVAKLTNESLESGICSVSKRDWNACNALLRTSCWAHERLLLGLFTTWLVLGMCVLYDLFAMRNDDAVAVLPHATIAVCLTYIFRCTSSVTSAFDQVPGVLSSLYEHFDVESLDTVKHIENIKGGYYLLGVRLTTGTVLKIINAACILTLGFLSRHVAMI